MNITEIREEWNKIENYVSIHKWEGRNLKMYDMATAEDSPFKTVGAKVGFGVKLGLTVALSPIEIPARIATDLALIPVVIIESSTKEAKESNANYHRELKRCSDRGDFMGIGSAFKNKVIEDAESNVRSTSTNMKWWMLSTITVPKVAVSAKVGKAVDKLMRSRESSSQNEMGRQ